MATLSSHTLNSVDGTHAGGIPLSLSRIEADGRRTELLRGATDEGGRFSDEVDLAGADREAEYELVLETGGYFQARGQAGPETQICGSVVVRFVMPDPDARYHIPMMLAPNSHSVWTSKG